MRALYQWRTFWIIGVVLLLLGAGLCLREVRGYRDELTDLETAMQAESEMLAHRFARVASTWLIRDNREAVESTARLMLFSSAVYVYISIQGERVLDLRSDDAADAQLGLATLDLSNPESDLMLGPESRMLRSGLLDTVAPVVVGGLNGETVGYVRIGFAVDDSALLVRIRSVVLGAITVGSWTGLMLLLGTGLWWIQRRGSLEGIETEPVPSVLTCGDLSVDTATCEVRLFDTPIQLTPKQYELLVLLASKPGEIFSDDDMLAAIWADSDYAASGDVKQCIYMLRRKLGAACKRPAKVVVNVKGFGYRLEPPPAEDRLTPA